MDADLTNARWQQMYVASGDFTGADLTGSDLTGSDLTGSDLTGGQFAADEPADFTGATLTGANFTATMLGPNSPAPVTASGPDGAAVTWAAPPTVTGEQLGPCSAPSIGAVSSGGRFPVGNTAVTCQIVSTSNGTFGTASFTVTVQPQPAATSIVSADRAGFVAGTPESFTVRATGTSTPALSETGVLPAGVSFHDNGDGTAVVSGTAGPGSEGAYPVRFTATAGTASAEQAFTLTVVRAASTTGADRVGKPGGDGRAGDAHCDG